MNRSQLEHLLRAACRVTEEDALLVIGSQAILGSYAEQQLPARAILSMEADLAAFDDPDSRKADQIDGALGLDSQFHETFGYYAEGVSVATAVLPDGWRSPLVRLKTESTDPGAGYCLEPHDLVLAKLAHGDARDYEFATALAQSSLIDKEILSDRLDSMPVPPMVERNIRQWLRGV